MRPLDIFSEKSSLRDSSPDKVAASSAMVYEAHSLATQIQFHKLDKHDAHDPHDEKSLHTRVDGDFNSAVGFGKRDQMALASLAFCSPLMMFGMGAALGISDTVRMNREQDLKEMPVRRLRQAALERAAQEQAKESKEAKDLKERPVPTEATKDAVLSNMILRLEAPTKKKKLEFKNREQNVLYPSAWKQADPEKNWINASKLVKKKQQMMDQLAKCRGLLQLNVVSAILTRIDKLDKELKKMGC